MPRARGRRSPLSAAALPDLGARPAARVPLLALGAASLLLGLVGGLARLGLVGGESLGPLVTHHGPLMAVGFLGTLIGVERAVAQRATWLLAAPLLTGGGVLLAAAGQAPLGPALAAAGAALLALGLARALHHRSAPWLVWQALGAASLAVGTAVWARAGWATPAVP